MPAWWAASIARTSGTIHSAACLGGSAVPRQPIGQATPFEQLECHIRRAVGFADVVDLQDIGMAERGDGFRLDLEAGDLDLVGMQSPRIIFKATSRFSRRCRAL